MRLVIHALHPLLPVGGYFNNLDLVRLDESYTAWFAILSACSAKQTSLHWWVTRVGILL
jgi:hypothetical protein